MNDLTISAPPGAVRAPNQEALELSALAHARGVSVALDDIHRLKPEPGDAVDIWRLSEKGGGWMLARQIAGKWVVWDILACLDQARLVARVIPRGSTSWLELMVAPLTDRWVVLEADPSGARELRICAAADGVAVWSSSASAERFAAAHAADGDCFPV